MSLARSLMYTLLLMLAPLAGASQESCGDDLDSVTLRNGATLPHVTVSTILLQLELLIKSSPTAYADLVAHARDQARPLDDTSRDSLDQFALLDDQKELSDPTRDVVLSSAAGEGADAPRFVSPVAAMSLDAEGLAAYEKRVDTIAADIVALAGEKNFPLSRVPGEDGFDGQLEPNGALVLRVDASGVPLFALTPGGQRHAFETGDTDHQTRLDFAGSLGARFGLKPIEDHPGLVVVSKDRNARPLPDPEFSGGL